MPRIRFQYPNNTPKLPGRFVWGHPNTDEAGRLIREINCQAVRALDLHGLDPLEEQIRRGLRHQSEAHFPNEKTARRSREPGADDE